MNTVIEKVEKAIASPTSPAERNVFLAAFATPTLAQLELRAPGGAFVRVGGNYPTEFQPNAVIAMRYESPAQLYAMAALFATLAKSMEDMQPTPIVPASGFGVEPLGREMKRALANAARVPDPIRRESTTATVSGAGAAVPVSAGEPAH
jgi:hypothetical protein